MFPFISLNHLAHPVSVDADLLAMVREVFSNPKPRGDGARVAAKRLLEAGYLNEAAYLEEWGTTQKTISANKAVSVYVPCFNGAPFLNETIQAILDQSFRPCEIIVVDDGSSDDSASIAARYPVRVIKHKENKGLAASRNTALQAVGGEFIAGIDADTIPDRFWLERVMSAFTDESIVGAAGRLVERYGVTCADAWRRRMMAQHHGDEPRKNIHLFGCNSVIRTKILKSLGGFNEHCKTSYDDIDLSERILKSGAATSYVPAAVCYHCRSDNSRTIIESAYRWRVPPFEMNGAFKESSSLSAKWLTEVREGMKDVMDLSKEGSDHLLFITYYGILASIVIDFGTYFNSSPNESRRDFAYGGFALVLRALSLIQHIALKTKQEIASRLIARFLKEFSDENRVNDIKSGVLENLKPDLLLQKINVPLDDNAKRLIVSLGELGSVLSMAPHIGAAIDKNLSDIIYEDTNDFRTPSRRVAVVCAPEILASQWGEKVLSSIRDKADGAGFNIFRAGASQWRFYELLQELYLSKPTEILIFVNAQTAPQYISLLAPITCRLPVAQIRFISQTALSNIPVSVEVV